MKVLVTGSEGFLGKWICKTSGGHTVIPFDSSIGDDVRSYGSVEQKMEGVDAVIHAAAISDLNESAANPGLNYAVNIAGTEVVASVAKKLNVPVLFISTCCVYGNAQPASCFGSIPVPTELYAWSKLAGEAVVMGYNPQNMIARIPTMYGPGMRPALFVYRVIDAIENGRPVEVHGDGRQTRQLGYVEDVAASLWGQLARSKRIEDHAPEEATSVLDICAIASGLMDKPVKIQFVPDRQGQIIRQNIHPGIMGVHRSFREGLASTISWYRNRNGAINP